MKRDLELIRKLVLAIEESPTGFFQGELKLDGYTKEHIAYHCYLLVDSGLAVGVETTHLGSSGPEYVIQHLTAAGHDFADSARDEVIWRKATAVVAQRGGSMTLDVVKELLVSLITELVGK